RRCVTFLYFGKLTTHIRKDEEMRIFARTGDEGNTLIGKVYTVIFFVYCEEQFRIYLRHIALLFGNVIVLCFLLDLLVAFLAEEFDQRTALRQTTECAVEVQTTVIFIG